MLQKAVKWSGFKYIASLLLPVVGYLIVNGLGIQDQAQIIQAVMGLCLLGCLLILIIMKRKGALKTVWVIRMIIAAGFVMRIGYMLYTPVNVRCHDLFEMDVTTDGKAGYLLRLILEGRLPESYDLQLYQQPFFYIAGAACSRLLNLILGNTEVFFLTDAAKVISCMASCLTLVVVGKLFEALEISPTSTCFGMAVAAFTPVFYLTGGRLGENAPVTFFTAAALLYTLYWNKKPNLKNTVILAFLYGFGMLTKMSMAIAALYTAWIFLKKLIEYRKSVGMYGKLLLFAGISLPLGLWYSVRNMILFGQGFTYVLVQDVNGPLYRGKVSLVQRFLTLDVGNLLETPYADPYTDHNYAAYLLKTELFGEFKYQVPEWIPVCLLFLNLVLTAVAAGYCIRLLFQRKKCGNAVIPMVWMLLFTGFAVNSYLSYPFGCTMDFRYYMMLTVCKALLIGKLLDGITLNKESTDLKILNGGIKKAVVCFGVLSCVMYCMI